MVSRAAAIVDICQGMACLPQRFLAASLGAPREVEGRFINTVLKMLIFAFRDFIAKICATQSRSKFVPMITSRKKRLLNKGIFQQAGEFRVQLIIAFQRHKLISR